MCPAYTHNIMSSCDIKTFLYLSTSKLSNIQFLKINIFYKLFVFLLRAQCAPDYQKSELAASWEIFDPLCCYQDVSPSSQHHWQGRLLCWMLIARIIMLRSTLLLLLISPGKLGPINQIFFLNQKKNSSSRHAWMCFMRFKCLNRCL